jgi:hypothetical protein
MVHGNSEERQASAMTTGITWRKSSRRFADKIELLDRHSGNVAARPRQTCNQAAGRASSLLTRRWASAIRARPASVLGPVDNPPWKRQRASGGWEDSNF